jgi:transaldolase
MKVFLDSASLADISEAHSHSITSGYTTNPALVAKEPPNILGYYGHIRDIVRIIGVDTPISIQPAVKVLRDSPQEHVGIIKGVTQSRQIIIKIAMSWDNLPLIRRVAMMGVHVNVTCIFTAEQAVAAMSAGARYVSIFWCRINDAKGNPQRVTRAVRDLINTSGNRTEIIAGSIRSAADAMDAFAAGAHIVTTGLPVLKAMANSVLSDASADAFEKARAEWDQKSAALADQLEDASQAASATNG